jgi:hypothetical protein
MKCLQVLIMLVSPLKVLLKRNYGKMKEKPDTISPENNSWKKSGNGKKGNNFF